MKKNNAVLYYAPVKPELFSIWEYYQTDLTMLQSSFSEVVVCHNLKCFLQNILKVDVVYSWWWHSSALVIILSKLLGRKAISTGAIHMFDCSKQKDFYSHNIFYQLSIKLGLKFSTMNLFISKDQMLTICSHLDVNNPQLLYSSLDDSKALADGAPKFQTKSEVVFCYHSDLSIVQIERKGLKPLLSAFLALVTKGIDVKLVVFGKKGDGLEYVNTFCVENNLTELVTVLTDVTKIKKMEIFRQSDLLVNVSFMEGFGNACLEAMSVGLPVVVSRFGASPELITDKDLISMDVSPEGIQKVLEWYLDLNSTDKFNLRQKVFKEAYKKFGFNIRLDNFKKLLQGMD